MNIHILREDNNTLCGSPIGTKIVFTKKQYVETKTKMWFCKHCQRVFNKKKV